MKWVTEQRIEKIGLAQFLAEMRISTFSGKLSL